MKQVCLIIFIVSFTFQCAIAQDTQIRGFMDIGVKYEDDTTSFNLGQLDSYITSDVTDRISFLGETTFSFKNDDELKVQVERVIAKYEVDNYLNFHIGKHHTPVGYWNTAYHHGTVLYPTIGKPLVFSYGGIFPIHTTGFMVSGDFIGKYKLGYNLLVGNGIGSSNLEDNDQSKSITLSVHASPFPGLQIVISNYQDKISSGVSNRQDTVTINPIRQNLLSASVIYLSNEQPYELIAELVTAQNKVFSSKFNSMSGYAYVGYKIKDWTPYYRYDFFDFDDNDPYYIIDNTLSHLVGVRYSFSYLSNIKLEYHHEDSDARGKRNFAMLQFGLGF